jgi:hypothetical protein
LAALHLLADLPGHSLGRTNYYLTSFRTDRSTRRCSSRRGQCEFIHAMQVPIAQA